MFLIKERDLKINNNPPSQFIAEIAVLLEQSLLINGAKNANYLASHAADYLAHALQGQWVYFPKPRNFDLLERNRQIATLYQRGGVTYAALAERFNLSRARISQIVQSAISDCTVS